MAVILPQSLQSDLQSSLPIIPNNGNPQGAYNMPATEQQEQAKETVDPYAWLQPSSFMKQIETTLADYDSFLEQLTQDVEKPDQKQLYNQVIRDGRFSTMPLDDYGIPYGTNVYTYPQRNSESEMPQYVNPNLPVIPGN